MACFWPFKCRKPEAGFPALTSDFTDLVLITNICCLHNDHKNGNSQGQKPKVVKLASASAIPLPLQKAINFLPCFIIAIAKARPGLIRAMRSDRQECMIKFLTALLLSTSLQHDGAICYINESWVKPKTLQELAESARISYSQAKRCLALLVQLGFITSKQIKRKNRISGKFEVSPAMRYLTQKFWQAVGLLDLFRQSVAWAKKHCKRIFLMPFKAVKLAEKTAHQAGSVVGEVMRNLSEGAIRAQYWCNKIRDNINQIK